MGPGRNEFSPAGVRLILNLIQEIQHLLRRYQTLNRVQGNVSAG